VTKSLAFAALLLVLGACSKNPASDSLVSVNGEAITQRDLDTELKLQGEGSKPDAVLDDLIDQALMLQEASKDGVNLSADDLENQVLMARAGAPIKEFQDGLAQRGLSYADWKERVRRQALCDELVRREIRSQLVIKRQDLKDYYWEHVTEFRRPESVRLRQVYCKTRSQAEKAFNELELGQPFDAVARQYSQAPEGPQGGELGWVGRKALPSKLAKAAFALKKGQTSEILASAYGYHILHVDDKREQESMSLDEAAPQIHEALLREREQPLYRNWLFELRSHSEIKRLQPKGNLS
jgi:parvulin-like peptidyl-prolyl isomerase